MGISGMTGFARVSEEAEWGSWSWEARSVNGKGLDVRVNSPSGLEEVDQAVRKAINATFKRGSLQIGLRIELSGAENVSINEDVLATLLGAYERAEGALATGSALATLMGIRGVVEAETLSMRDLKDVDGAIPALIETGKSAIRTLHERRSQEGGELRTLFVGQLSEMATLVQQALQYADAQKSALAEKYRARIAEFDTEGAVSDERLATEVAVIAAKADVTEELDRLQAHIARGQSLIESDGSVGRDLGFLAQELNREANTLCSKSASLDLTNAGLALKSVIDQFKEQAANVE
ncbi:MAG: YicC family protein [Henriciella sp.]|nr:YicC family protein [Henriciella sp.]MBO6694641.1 YicC family protein [Henriciella sp.]